MELEQNTSYLQIKKCDPLLSGNTSDNYLVDDGVEMCERFGGHNVKSISKTVLDEMSCGLVDDPDVTCPEFDWELTTNQSFSSVSFLEQSSQAISLNPAVDNEHGSSALPYFIRNNTVVKSKDEDVGILKKTEHSKENELLENKKAKDVSELSHNNDETCLENTGDVQSFICETCGLSYFTQAELLQHNFNHLNPNGKSFQCEVCGKVLVRKDNFVRHVKIAHFTHSKFECDVCFKTFNRKDTLRSHKKTHLRSKCEKCRKFFPDEFTLNDHIKKKHESFLCKFKGCTKIFISEEFLEKHSIKHLKKVSWDCNNCGQKFKKKADYKQHMLIHDDVNKFRCYVVECHKKFIDDATLRKHIYNVHSKDRQYQCRFNTKECYKFFATVVSRNIHMLTHLTEKTNECTKCGKEFTNKIYLNKHMRRHLAEKTVKCEYKKCNKKFKSRAEMLAHVEIHSSDKPYLCGYASCDKRFKCKKYYDAHMMAHYKNKNASVT